MYRSDILYTYEGEGRIRGVTDMIKVALLGESGLRHVDVLYVRVRLFVTMC